MRKRDDNALEVWLTSPSRGIGWLTGGYTRLREDRIELLLSEVTATGEIIDERRTFRLRQHHEVVSENDLIWLEAKATESIPGYAERIRMTNLDQSKFVWEVLSIDQDDHEWMFDNPNFEPFDESEPDCSIPTETLDDAMDCMVQSMNRTINNQFFTGGAVTNTVSSPPGTSANESVLTVEKLKDAMRLLRRA